MVLQTKAAKARRKLYNDRKAKNLCTSCGKKPEKGNQCDKCKANGAKAMKKYFLKNWAQKKVDNLRAYDRRSGLTWNKDDYITKDFVEALRKKHNNSCIYCGMRSLQVNNMRATNDGFTIERKDNEKPHIKSNCTIACYPCNNKKIGDLSDFKPATQEQKRGWLRLRIAQNLIKDINSWLEKNSD